MRSLFSFSLMRRCGVLYRYVNCRNTSTASSDQRFVRVGCSSGFWGDTADATPQLLRHGRLNYLVLDYLSEITMSLLTASRLRQPDMGYAPDFVQTAMTSANLRELRDKNVRVLTNAGGVNPHGCAAALQRSAEAAGVPLRIAVITGDQLGVQQMQWLLEPSTSDLPSEFLDRMVSSNVYLGCGALARALSLGADLVIAGRCVDSALVLAPLVHEFGWSLDSNVDWDLLASGSLAGHLLECGAQATGGISTQWRRSCDSWHNIGFPIAECGGDGSLFISKPPDTGGLLSPSVVSEQLVYEIGDPRRYLLPDVTCDFSRVRMQIHTTSEGENAVRVTGARGSPPPSTYKVGVVYRDGFRATAVCPVVGPYADIKAHRTAEAILARCRRMLTSVGLADFERVHVQALGAGEMYPPTVRQNWAAKSWSNDHSPNDISLCHEAVLWLAVSHRERRAVELFSSEVAAAGTGMAPGLTMLVGGRPRVSPLLRFHSLLCDKQQLPPVEIHLNGRFVENYRPTAHGTASAAVRIKGCEMPEASQTSTGSFPIRVRSYRVDQLAYTRSGDKGDTCNIGVIARRPEWYPLLCERLSARLVENYFSHLLQTQSSCAHDTSRPIPFVRRYELPGICALNFVLERALGGGGVASLRPDPQGKSYGQLILDLELCDMPELDVDSSG